MAVVVRSLPPALGERDELVADVDERHAPGSAAQLRLEDAAVELVPSSTFPTSSATWLIPTGFARMIVSLRIATGALGGALVRSPIAAAATGPILRFYGDRVPHEDIDSRRFEIGSGVAGVLALALVRGPFDSATVGAIASAAPDIEHAVRLPRPGGGSSSPGTGSRAGTDRAA